MKTLIIYKNNGEILIRQYGSVLDDGETLEFLNVDVPEGKVITGINTSIEPHTAIIEDIPKTDIELLQLELAENTKDMAEKDLAIEQLQKDIADLTKQIANGGNE